MTAILGLIVALVTFAGVVFEIPNSVMNWFINYRTLFGKPDKAWLAPELPAGCETVFVLFGREMYVEYQAKALTNGPYTGVHFAANISSNGVKGIDIKPFIKGNRLYLQTPLPLAESTNVITIKMDESLDKILPPRWDWNANSNAFEIVDAYDLPLLQVWYKRPDSIVVNGIFVSPVGYMITFGDEEIALGKHLPQLDTIKGRKPLFKYPGNLHRGDLAEP